MWLIKCVHAMVCVCVCVCLRLCVGNANMRNFVFWQLNQKWRVLKCKMFVCGSSCGAAEQSKRGDRAGIERGRGAANGLSLRANINHSDCTGCWARRGRNGETE